MGRDWTSVQSMACLSFWSFGAGLNLSLSTWVSPASRPIPLSGGRSVCVPLCLSLCLLSPKMISLNLASISAESVRLNEQTGPMNRLVNKRHAKGQGSHTDGLVVLCWVGQFNSRTGTSKIARNRLDYIHSVFDFGTTFNTHKHNNVAPLGAAGHGATLSLWAVEQLTNGTIPALYIV